MKVNFIWNTVFIYMKKEEYLRDDEIYFYLYSSYKKLKIKKTKSLKTKCLNYSPLRLF